MAACATGRGEVVVQAGQLDVTVDPLLGDDCACPALAYDHALVGEIEKGGPDRGAGQTEAVGELHLVLQPLARLERTGFDRGLKVLRYLEVQGDRASPVPCISSLEVAIKSGTLQAGERLHGAYRI